MSEWDGNCKNEITQKISKSVFPVKPPWPRHHRDILDLMPWVISSNSWKSVPAATKKHVRTRKFKVTLTHHGIDTMHKREGSIQLKSNAWIIHRHIFPHFQTRENYKLNRQNINTLCKKVKGFSPRITKVREWIMQTEMENSQKEDSSAHQHNIEFNFSKSLTNVFNLCQKTNYHEILFLCLYQISSERQKPRLRRMFPVSVIWYEMFIFSRTNILSVNVVFIAFHFASN